MSETRVQHDAVEACRNVDRSRIPTPDAFGNSAPDAEEFCGDCFGRFDDPDHGRFAACKATTKHFCRARI